MQSQLRQLHFEHLDRREHNHVSNWLDMAGQHTVRQHRHLVVRQHAEQVDDQQEQMSLLQRQPELLR